MKNIKNIRIEEFQKLISPDEIRSLIPETAKSKETIISGRQAFADILKNKDQRFVIILGPCSIHQRNDALEYARKLNKLKTKYQDKLFILMRVYFEKPRTTVGWKGLINDPHLDESNNIQAGIQISRQILIDIADLGLPTATELLDPIIAAYLGELVSWAAIGARTTESQTHRQMASGLSASVGFKNNTDGNLDVAINGMQSAKKSHSFIGINDAGHCSVVRTKGNQNTHIVLRGGNGRPNYHMEDIEECETKLKEKKFIPKILIDCSHENSGKNHEKQKIVVKDIIAQKKFGNQSIFGIMLESNLLPGNQSVPDQPEKLKPGVSITDACIGWKETEELIKYIHESLS